MKREASATIVAMGAEERERLLEKLFGRGNADLDAGQPASANQRLRASMSSKRRNCTKPSAA